LPIYQLTRQFDFPDPSEAEDGIIAIGGDLHPSRLLLAYKSGIFPWFNKDEPIIWWSPDPRFVLFPEDLKVSKSMQQLLKRQTFKVTFDTDFKAVIHQCASVRYGDRYDTWITDDMEHAYLELHQMGYAHSVEVWDAEDQLVGGLYGVAIGKCFFGESMFFKRANASKYGFITLVKIIGRKRLQTH
jgi:leucyl/phenylalanyl-tRNA---protein transferase